MNSTNPDRVGIARPGTSMGARPSRPLVTRNSTAKRLGRMEREIAEQRARLHAEYRNRRRTNSSTGSWTSHDTVTTDSQSLPIISNAEAEGTQKSQSHLVNTSAIGRNFPGWIDIGDFNPDEEAQRSSPQPVRVPTTPVISRLAKANAHVPHLSPMDEATDSEIDRFEGKENIPPPADPATLDSTFDLTNFSKYKRSRADMQARVENASQASSVLSQTPKKAIPPSTLSQRPSRVSPKDDDNNTQSSLLDFLAKFREEKRQQKEIDLAQMIEEEAQQAAQRKTSRLTSPALQSQPNVVSTSSPAGQKSATAAARSFFLPTFRHLPDWTTGTLKLSMIQNGMPMFARVRDAAVAARSVDGVSVPEDDEEILVSLDKLQEEVRELHDHDAMLQHEAEQLQKEVAELQAETRRLKARRSSDSAIGSESDHDIDRHTHQLRERVAELQEELDKASRKLNVHDLHTSSLIAERDEALRQASAARDKVKKVQDELNAANHDLHSSLQLRRENDMLRIDNKSSRSALDALRQQYEDAVLGKRTLEQQQTRLRQELDSALADVASLREEVDTLRRENQDLKEHNRELLQDHAGMEKQNNMYFKEMTSLRHKMSSQDEMIQQLQENALRSQATIKMMDQRTTDTTIVRENDELRNELDGVKQQCQEQADELQKLRAQLQAKDDEIQHLSDCTVESENKVQRMATRHQQEYGKLSNAYEKAINQSRNDRAELERLTQSLTDKEPLQPVNEPEPSQVCIRLAKPERIRPESPHTQQVNDRRSQLARKANALTNKITEYVQDSKSITKVKVTRTTGSFSRTTTRATSFGDDIPTDELTQGTNFTDEVGSKIFKLKQVYRDARDTLAPHAQVEDVESDISEYSLPPLPREDLYRDEPAQAKGPLVGILKKNGQPGARDDDTGRFSVKSGFSMTSMRSAEMSTSPVLNVHRRTESASETWEQPSQPAKRKGRSNSEGSQQVPVVSERQPATEQNVTSGFFVPDITLEAAQRKKASEMAYPSLSKDARQVLDRVCKHRSDNCDMCSKISGTSQQERHHTETHHSESHRTSHKTTRSHSRMSKSDKKQASAPASNEDPTQRPAIAPGSALLIATKIARDELAELRKEYMRVNGIYCQHDASRGRRERRRMEAQIKELVRKIKVKSEQVYRLYDVREGQKEVGQDVTEDFDITILSDIQADATCTTTGDSKSMSWEGFD